MVYYNVRDRVEWDVDQEKKAEEAVKHNSAILLPDDKKGTHCDVCDYYHMFCL